MLPQSSKTLLMIVLLMFGLLLQVGAQDTLERTVELPDFGSITYPTENYSLRPDSVGIQADRAEMVLFPGAFSLVPNDAFIVEQQAAGNIAYTLRMASVINTNATSAEDLATLFGQLPLLAYDATALETVDVQALTIAGLPAVRVDNLPLAEDAVVTHIIILTEVSLIEVVIQPATLYGAPNHNVFMSGDAEANRALIETMLSSLTILQ